MKTAKKIVKISFIVVSCFVLCAGFVIFGYLIKLSTSLKFNEELVRQVNSEFHIYDNENSQLSESNNQKSVVKISELPAYVPASFLSIEDKKFYSHNGLNFKRIVRALFNNLKSGGMREGASTISQQLIKNTHLSNEKTVDRKVKEIILTLKMEKKLSKDTILETYLNAIYFGNGAYGLDNASKIYFNKSAGGLTLGESAILAGLIRSPKTYSPLYNLENCKNRRDLVLSEMLKDGKITDDQYQNAIKEKIEINTGTISRKNYYEQAVIDEACRELNISEKDLAMKDYHIFTYLDKPCQENLQEKFSDSQYFHVNSYGNTADGAGIIIDNETGGILAFSGKSSFDLVNMTRSPGSAIKPILVYAPALESGKISPVSPILDEKIDFGNYTPQNVGNHYYGYISATETVEKSLNIPAIKILQYAGIDNAKNMAKSCGIKFDGRDNNYAIALGGFTKGTTVKELVNSYLPFSNGGNFIEAKFIRKICDKNGKAIYENREEKRRVMSEETAYLMTDMLISGVQRGTSSRLNVLDYQVAGKTGTTGIKGTNNNSDVWSIAYTTGKTVGIWLGNSTNEKEKVLEGSNNGGTYCTSIVKDVFKGIYTGGKRPKNFLRPAGIVDVELDSLELENNHALKLADENTPEIFKTTAIFNKQYVPTAVAKSFSELSAVVLNVEIESSKPKVSFKALPQVEYKIFRIEEDDSKCVETVKNKKGSFEFIDRNAKADTFYTYYVEAVAKNHSSQTLSKKIKSNSVKVFTPKQTFNDRLAQKIDEFIFA